jgi:hypothetical protein
MRRLAFALIALLMLLGAAGPSDARPPAARAKTFLSLWPACACGRATELDAFSLATGHREGRLGRVSPMTGETVSPPAASAAGPVLLTVSSGPKCAGIPGNGFSAGPCNPTADSCSGRVQRLDPAGGAWSTLLTIPASTLVSDAVPSPDGTLVAMRSAGCATSYFDESLVIRDLASGRQWAIGADAPRCHEIDRPSWSPDGSRLVFAYRPSILRYGTKPAARDFCTSPRFGRLVVVRADRASSIRSWKPIGADQKCSFTAAAFDRDGIAAVEACQRGGAALNLGSAYLLQLGTRHRVVKRIALMPGWEEGLVSTVARDGTVLISQDQPANAGYPERDWIWQFDGHRLRLIASYRARDAAQVIGVPW